jgi:hypothetical protein
MVVIHLPDHLTRNIILNANTYQKNPLKALSQKISSVAHRSLQAIKDFYGCLKQSFKITLLTSPLSLRVGYSFKTIPIKYRLIISMTLIVITNVFTATVKYFKMPKSKDVVSQKNIFELLRTMFKDKDIKDIKDHFNETTMNIAINESLTPQERLRQISIATSSLKQTLLRLTSNQSLRVLNHDSKDVFITFWNEKFETFCKKATLESTNTVNILTNWESSLLKHLDPDIVKEGVMTALSKELALSDIPSSVDFKCIYTWFDQINWTDKTSPYYLVPQNDPDQWENLSPSALRSRIGQALHLVENRVAIIGAPKEKTPEFTKFYDNIELKIKACIWHLQQQEEKLNELAQGKSYADLDPSTQREFRFVCENKARLVCQIGIAGSHCPVRLKGEISQIFNQLYQTKSDDEETSSLEDSLTKILSDLRLEIANEAIAKMDPNTHNYAAYMEAVGQPFNVPGAFDEIEHMIQFPQERINQLAKDFSTKYTRNAMIKKIQAHFEKSQAFREKIIDWYKDQSAKWKVEKYNALFVAVQKRVAEELNKDEPNPTHQASDLYLNALNQVDPQTAITLDETTDEKITLQQLANRLENNLISFEDFLTHLTSLDQISPIIQASRIFMEARFKNLRVVKRTWIDQLNSLNCQSDFKDLAVAILQNKKDLKAHAEDQLNLNLTRALKIKALNAIMNEFEIAHVDYKKFEDDEAFAKSLRDALVIQQKNDYIEHIFGDQMQYEAGQQQNLPKLTLKNEHTDRLLVGFNILKPR